MKRGTTTWGKPTAPAATHYVVELSDARLKQLLHLCHPDRHSGSAMSTDVFQWLQEIKKRKGVDTGKPGL